MSGYSGEPEKMNSTWIPENHNRFEYGPIMRSLANSIIVGSIKTDELDEAIIRLCETASVNDSVECRTVLAQIADIPFTELGIYRDAVGKKIGMQDPAQVERVFELAIEAYLMGDANKYNLLTASVGYYPYPAEILKSIYS